MTYDNIENIQRLWQQMGNPPDAGDQMALALEKARRYRCGKLTQRLIRYYRMLFAMSMCVIMFSFTLPGMGMSTLTTVLYALTGIITGIVNLIDLRLIRKVDSYMGEPCTAAVRSIRKVRTHLQRGLYIGMVCIIPVLCSLFYDIVHIMDNDPEAIGMLYGGIIGGIIGLCIGLHTHFRMQRLLNNLYDAFNTEN